MSILMKTKKLYTMARPTWLDAAGMTKGIDHDRQHLGIILSAGQPLRIRKANNNGGAFTLRLLNSDASTEHSVSVGTSWVTLTATVPSVPFIDTPYGVAEPTVEYEYADTAKTLPTYEKGDSESNFFHLWDSQNAEFALITSEFFNMLIPAADKEILRTLHPQKPVDRLIDMYGDVFNYYNNMAGISLDAGISTDRNIKNRYFIKADKSGIGGGYYGIRWTAESTSSVKGFWLWGNEPGWGGLHEISHGYQGHFMSDRYFGPSEVWNNIYCACYQNTTMGERQFKDGWLYNYGRQAAVEKTINDFISNGTPANSWDLRSKLHFMVQMVDKAGIEAFTHFNQQYRMLSNQSGFSATNYPLLDMLSESYASTGNKVDVTPFMLLVGAQITRQQQEKNLFSLGKAVYPLNQLVDGTLATRLQQQLNLKSTLSLVDVQQLKVSGQTGSVSLWLNINDFRQIIGESVQVMDGSEIVRQQTITHQEMLFDDLPIGVYTLRMPTGKSQKYCVQPGYLIVKPGQHSQQINYEPKKASLLLNQKLTMVGLSDVAFAEVAVDHAKKALTVAVTRNTPHSYFPDQTYVEIVIRNSNNNEIFRKAIPGTHATISSDDITFVYGDIIEIYHREPTRLRLVPAKDGVIARNEANNTFTITPAGLRNNRLNNDPELDLRDRLEEAARTLLAMPAMGAADYVSVKDDIYLAIQVVSQPLRDALYRGYHAHLPVHNELPNTPDVPDVPNVPDVPDVPNVPDVPETPEPAPPLYPLWNATQVYVGKEKVTHKGKNYLAKWWIGAGVEPGLTDTTGAADGDGRPWTQI